MFLFSLYMENRMKYASLSLKNHYNRPVDLLITYMDQLVRGLTTQNTQKVDMLFTQTVFSFEIVQNLFFEIVNDDDVNFIEYTYTVYTIHICLHYYFVTLNF